MRRTRPILGIVTLLLFLAASAIAGDFDWVRDFNLRAGKNPRDFRARLASRFQAGDEQIGAVIDDVSKPSEAYIVFRLEEMSGQPLDRVMAEYEYGRKKGWDVIAKRLGVRPGSKEFRAIKAGQDLFTEDAPRKAKDTANGKP
ncbi:MAG: hypothetical protein MUE57_04275 [Syntrophales bacterium]|nr:hypothetical protein [Syntrophales bacterium]MCU0583040.1 hypothetical protein [Syntrophales bacterium]